MKKLLMIFMALLFIPVATAAIEFDEDLSGGLPDYMELGAAHGAGSIDFSSGDASWSTGDSYRQYVRTKDSDYNTQSFVFEGTVNISPTNSWGAAFCGIGKGDGNPNHYGEPIPPSIKMNVGPTVSYLSGAMDFNIEPNPDRSGIIGERIAGASGDGTHRIRLVWNAVSHSAYGQIDQNYSGGSFNADYTSSVFTIATLNAGNSHIYFGGGNSVAWDDLSLEFILGVGNPVPEDGAVGVDPKAMISWDPTTSVSDPVYSISIGTDPNCDDIVLDHSTGSATEYDPGIALNYETTYYWCLTATGDNGSGDSITSTPMSFTTGGKVLSQSPVGFALSNTDLTWEGDGLADNYNVYFSKQGQTLAALSNPYTSDGVPNSDLPTLTAGSTYQWRVDQLDSTGTAMVTGDVVSFKIIEETSSPLRSGLLMHLDASKLTGLSNGDLVEVFPDCSGNGNNAIGSGSTDWLPTYSSDSANGQPAVLFDEVDDDLATSLSLQAPYTVFAVFSGNDTAVPHRAISGGPNDNNNWLIGPYRGNICHYALGWVSNTTPVNPGQYYITAATNTTTASALYIDAVDSTTNSTFTGSPGTIYLGANGRYVEPLDGGIAEVIIYDKALTQADMDTMHLYLTDKYGVDANSLAPVAFNPSPYDGEEFIPSTGAVLSWSEPVGASSPTYEIFFGEPGSMISLGTQSETTFALDTLTGDTTYEWRIDVTDGGTTTGYVWSFTTAPPTAHTPDPVDGASGVAQNAVISWTAGEGAESHDIYFSEVEDDVINGNAFIGNQTETEYSPDMVFGMTYYWRIDEHIGDNVYQGDVWVFTTGEPECSEAIPGDVNSDCIVDIEDFAILAANWLTCTLSNGNCP